MTKQEIIAEINAKIAGQGTNIDAGSALPGILQGIIDLIPEAPAPQVQADLTVTDPTSPAYVKMPIWQTSWDDHIITEGELSAASRSGIVRSQSGDAYLKSFISSELISSLSQNFDHYTIREIFVNSGKFDEEGAFDSLNAFIVMINEQTGDTVVTYYLV